MVLGENRGKTAGGKTGLRAKRLDTKVPGRFGPESLRPSVVSALGRFGPGRFGLVGPG